MKKILIFSMAFIVLVLSGCTKTEPAAEPTPMPEPTAEAGTPTPAPEESPVPEETEEALRLYTIDFAGLQLQYPEKWKDTVTVNITENKAAFVCGDVPLFDLLINSNEGYVLGTVCENEYPVLSIVSYDIADTDNTDLFAMAEDVNVILQNLMTDYDFVAGEAVEKPDDSILEIETSVTTLKYAGKWKDAVTIEVSEDKVCFSNNGTPLFDLVFSECEGFLLGTYSGTPIYIVDYPVSDNEQAAMQEDVNVILEHLMADPNFEING